MENTFGHKGIVIILYFCITILSLPIGQKNAPLLEKNSMNKFILFVCILFPEITNSQSQMRYAGADGVPHNLEFLDLSGQPIRIGDHSNIDGTPLLQSKWAFCIILLKNGGTLSDSSVNYSLFDDKLFFKRNDKMYPINYPVREFLLQNLEDSDKNKVFHFQNGFPEIKGKNRNDSLTFYEILFRGNSIQLLKWQHKKIEETYMYGGPVKNEYSLVQEFFVFFPKENKIIQLGINLNLNVIRKKLPEYSNQIQAYSLAHKLNWKKEEDVIQLFSFLDSVNLL